MPDLPPLPPVRPAPAFAPPAEGFAAARRAARRRAAAALAGAAGVAVLVVAVVAASAGGAATLRPARPSPTVAGPLPGDGLVSTPWATAPPDGPLEVFLDVLTAAPRAGDLVRFRVRVKRPALGLHWYTVAFGDGRSAVGQGLVPDPACAGTELDFVRADEVDQVVEHAYRAGGTFAVTVAAGHVAGCARSPLEARATTRLVVLDRATPSNGPAEPYAYLPRVMGRPSPAPDGGRVVRLTPPTGGDDDGWVSFARVDWGDGTSSDYDFGLAGCNGTARAWPHGHRSWPDSAWHTYQRPGAYRVTVTVVSTGCDGSSAQEAREVVEVRV